MRTLPNTENLPKHTVFSNTTFSQKANQLVAIGGSTLYKKGLGIFSMLIVAEEVDTPKVKCGGREFSLHQITVLFPPHNGSNVYKEII